MDLFSQLLLSDQKTRDRFCFTAVKLIGRSRHNNHGNHGKPGNHSKLGNPCNHGKPGNPCDHGDHGKPAPAHTPTIGPTTAPNPANSR